MATSSNLVPTPIVDKNGKHTTVHRKDSAKSQSGRAIPAPAVVDDATKTKNLRSHIAYDLAFIDTNHAESRSEQRVVATLASMGYNELRSLYETTLMVLKLDKEGTNRGCATALTSAIENNYTKRIETIKDHGAKISGHLTMGDLVNIVEKMRNMDNSRISFTDNLEAHIEAAGKFLSITGTNTPDYYHLNEKFIRFINKHPDKVDDALAYRQERALKVYNEEDFQEWLNAGALRDGML